MDDNNRDSLQDQIDYIAKRESPLQKYGFQILTLIFLAGGGWTTLQSVNALAEDNKQEIAKEVEKTNNIDKKLVRIETTQEQMKKQLEEAADTAKENQRKLDQILNKLED